ncbi:HNH endonuclease [Photobacterium carnosum]|uniref:Uncharacterized protein n=1 Tax=Photobacterium carnosum TaxID=2023717 RepID=A0A2N4UMB1_9GAMM|nr:HNH endonuclease domain-containing protein [Photobacterium carnosum]PLC56159.1 hypothetical protein CIK00_19750 [Photobacterium carnosum]
MPLINEEFNFTREQQELVSQKLADDSFLHTDWGNDDLQDVRSSLRRFYRSKQIGKCAFCFNEVSFVSAANAQVEHIAPKSLHRQFIFEPKNLCVICADCNTIKRDQEVLNEMPETINNPNARVRYPRASSAFKIVHPHFDNYQTHIIKRGKVYVDRTPKGQFTISACKLNRFFHQFGFEEDFVDDEILIVLMTSFIASGTTHERKIVLDALKDLMILM